MEKNAGVNVTPAPKAKSRADLQNPRG